MEQADRFRIPVAKLRRVCDLDTELDFCTSSADVPGLEGVIGQDRAVRSMQFGLAMDAPGYNIFVSGQPGTGKTTYVNASVTQAAADGPVPDDWCYVNNFADIESPVAISLPAGQGRQFQKDMDELVRELRAAMPKAFESSDYEQRKKTLETTFQNHMQERLNALQKQASEVRFLFRQAGGKLMIMPLKDDKPFSNQEFAELPDEQRQALEATGHQLEGILEEILREGKSLEKQTAEKIIDLEKQIARAAATPSFERLREKYAGHAKVLAYLEAVRKDIEDNRELFLESETEEAEEGSESGGEEELVDLSLITGSGNGEEFTRYKVNLFISHDNATGSPVIIETNPNYYNLFGKVEYKNQLMSVSTDFTMVKPGAIHRANGGYLILQARDALIEPLVWEQLKRTLKYRQAVIENIGEQYRNIPTSTLRMEPIPLKLKVILIGSPLFYLVLTSDEDFAKLFKVKVDFDVEMARSRENLCKYVSFVSSLCKREKLQHLDRTALAQIIEYGSRLAGDQTKLSTRFNEVGEIIYEASALAVAAGSDLVSASHVDEAIRQRHFRRSRVEEKVQEMILTGKLLIDTAGERIGQVNGLSVVELGNFAFGQPSRITAVTFMGKDGIIAIERETEMSGSIHSKGVLTLSGYLGLKFAQDKPLSLTAQITFEQNYGGIEGDSASSAELYAILSSLADAPIRQSLAVTGSVNQYGEIQPIGGVTEKIEGFFDICVAKGLTGDQGVLIPHSNIDNLMLKDEVLDAVRARRFHLYAVQTIEDGIEILTGLPAGPKDPTGTFPENSIFARANQKLQTFHQAQQGDKD